MSRSDGLKASRVPVPRETARTVLLAARSGADDDVSRALTLLGDRCPRAQQAVLEGLRRDRCNWKVVQTSEGATVGFQDALTLASCLVLEGHQKALRGDGAGAARNYVEALSFSLDLEIGVVAGAPVALSAVDIELHALGRLAVSVEGDGRFWGEIDEHIAGIGSNLPGRSELRLDRLLLSATAVEVAQGRAKQSELRGSVFVPWWPFVAYQLWRDDLVLRRLEHVLDVPELPERKRLLKDISLFATESVSLELREPVVSWIGTLATTGDVEQLYEAVLAAIRLEQLAGTLQLYPANVDALQIPIGRYGLRYERTSNGKGYRIWNEVANEGGVPSVILERDGTGRLWAARNRSSVWRAGPTEQGGNGRE
jgi:hypothetical protein